MSSTVLLQVEEIINFYGYLIPMIFGNIGNIFIIILFVHQHRNACSIYLTSSAIVNNIYLTFIGYAQIFPFYYADYTVRAFVLCKLRAYLPSVLGLITKTLIALACIDRFMITSTRAKLRGLSTPKRAKYCIIISIILWPLICCHICIMTTIVDGQCSQFGTYFAVFTAFIILFVGIIPPVILGVSGYLTCRNMRQSYTRIQPVLQTTCCMNRCIRRRDRALLIIVVAEIFVYVVTATPFPIFLLQSMISHYAVSEKGHQYHNIENFVRNITLLLLYVNFATPFYIYLMSSKIFRRDFKQLFAKLHRSFIKRVILRITPTVTDN